MWNDPKSQSKEIIHLLDWQTITRQRNTIRMENEGAILTIRYTIIVSDKL